MNRREADIFEDIFHSREIFEHIDPEMDALDVLQSYEDLALPEALDRLTDRIIRNLDHRDHGRENRDRVN